MAEISVAKVETKQSSKREIYAQVCYHYPQYKLQDVANLPQRDVALLLQVANKVEGLRMLNLTQIVAAPHSKNGSAVKKLTEHFKRITKDG